LYGNHAASSGAIELRGEFSASIEKSIIMGTDGGTAVFVDPEAEGEIVLSCCDLCYNSGGDWVNEISGQANERFNIDDDPQLCRETYTDFRLQAGSPCAPYEHACQDGMGAWSVDLACSEASGTAASGDVPSRLTLTVPSVCSARALWKVRFGIPKSAAGSAVALVVLDLAGREVKRLAVGHGKPGVHEIMWDGLDSGGRPLASGIYFWRLEVGAIMEAGRTVVVD
jgi:hypothetical protein